MPTHMKYVLISGAAGGVVSWVYSVTVGTSFPVRGVAAILACCILGAASALISVYIVANTDLTNTPRLVAFAVLCGIFWKPVIDSSITFVNQKKEASSSQQKSQAALQKLQTAVPSQQVTAVAEATDATTDLLKTSDRLGDHELESEARKRTESLIQEISKNAAANPKTAAVALMQIKDAASQTGNPDLASLANTKLRVLQAPAPPPVKINEVTPPGTIIGETSTTSSRVRREVPSGSEPGTAAVSRKHRP